MILKKTIIYLSLIVTVLLVSCTKEEEPCMETICPEGMTACYDRPCDFIK